MSIIVLHYNYHPSGGGALTIASGADYYILMVLETVCVSAVNVFILFSGYFGYRNKSVRPGKLIALLLQTMAFSLMFSILYSATYSQWSARSLLASLIPANYFVIQYVVLMLIAPFINILIDSLDNRQLALMTAFFFAIFSVYSASVDVLKEITGSGWNGLSSVGIDGSMAGYTIVNFVTVYVIGAWIGRSKSLNNVKTASVTGVLLIAVAADLVWKSILPGTAWCYNNPVIVIEAAAIFILFGRIPFDNKLINEIAPASFTSYLIQGTILGHIVSRIQETDSGATIMLVLLGSLLGIYFIAYIAMKIWNLIMRPLFKVSINKIPMIRIG